MKFLHIGDLHLGRTLGDFDMLEDQRYILNQIINMALEHQVDGILVAGDVYDKAIPGERAVKLFDEFLSELAEKGLRAFVISGNHDSDERLNFGSKLFEKQDIFISAKVGRELYKKRLEDEWGTVNIYLLPFVKASQVKKMFPEAEIDSYDRAIEVLLEASNIDTSERNIIVAHQFVAGANLQPMLAGSEGAAVQNVGLVEQIGLDRFYAFDYVALGHIHSPQQLGRKEIRYSGSPLKYSVKEIRNEKSVPLITIKEKGNITIELLPLIPKRDFRHLKGTLEKLLDKKNIISPQDYIYMTLIEDNITDAMSIVQQYYPYTVKLDYENERVKEIENFKLEATEEKIDFSELTKEFYYLIYGQEISSEEQELLKKVAREAGINYEAN